MLTNISISYHVPSLLSFAGMCCSELCNVRKDSTHICDTSCVSGDELVAVGNKLSVDQWLYISKFRRCKIIEYVQILKTSIHSIISYFTCFPNAKTRAKLSLGQRLSLYLASACCSNDYDIVKILLDHGADVHLGNERSLLLACSHADLNIIQLIITHGADVSFGFGSPLRETAECGRLDIVKYLISVGADVNAGDGDAMVLAARHDHVHIMSYLTDLVDLSVCGSRALLEACKSNCISAVIYLAGFPEVDLEYSSAAPLSCAAAFDNVGAVMALLDYGCDVHRCEESALRNAVLHSKDDETLARIIQILASAGADLSVWDGYVMRTCKERGLTISADITASLLTNDICTI